MPRLHIPECHDPSLLAPKVRDAVEGVLREMQDRGFTAKIFETLRTPERQWYLYGKGRTAEQCLEMNVPPQYAWPTCPDGQVTKSPAAIKSWHGYGLACDIVENDATPWLASQAFWNTLGASAKRHGLVWGGNWKFLDLPHVQWGACPQSPKGSDALALKHHGTEYVWTNYRAL